MNVEPNPSNTTAPASRRRGRQQALPVDEHREESPLTVRRSVECWVVERSKRCPINVRPLYKRHGGKSVQVDSWTNNIDRFLTLEDAQDYVRDILSIDANAQVYLHVQSVVVTVTNDNKPRLPSGSIVETDFSQVNGLLAHSPAPFTYAVNEMSTMKPMNWSVSDVKHQLSEASAVDIASKLGSTVCVAVAPMNGVSVEQPGHLPSSLSDRVIDPDNRLEAAFVPRDGDSINPPSPQSSGVEPMNVFGALEDGLVTNVEAGPAGGVLHSGFFNAVAPLDASPRDLESNHLNTADPDIEPFTACKCLLCKRQ